MLASPARGGSSYDPVKRVLDLAIASAGLLVLAVPMAVIALTVRRSMGRPVLYSETRPGRRGDLFRIYKFRSMTEKCDSQGNLLPDAERITRLGSFLRASSLDELPELFNVLRGDMSIVGPRPLLASYLQRYTPEQQRRHEVRPGITGQAQISGRQDISFSQRIAYDVWYVDNRSLLLDLKIIIQTLPRMLASHGVRNGQDVADVDDLPAAPDAIA